MYMFIVSYIQWNLALQPSPGLFHVSHKNSVVDLI